MYLIRVGSMKTNGITHLRAAQFSLLFFTGLFGAMASVVKTYDFNQDGKPDYAVSNGSTGQTTIWYLHNNVDVGSACGPTLPAGWSLVDVADFNQNGKPDYALFNVSTRQTAIWYLNNNFLVSGAYGPTLPAGWQLIATGDFNGDGHPDYVLYNASTRQTAIWYLNNNIYVGGAYGPSLADIGSSYSNSKVPYSINRPAILTAIGGAYSTPIGYGDFNGDGIPDIVFAPNTPTGLPIIIALGQPGGSYVDGTTQVISGQVPAPIVGRKIIVGDFNGDGRPDIFIDDTGYDQPPWPGNHNWLLLSDGAGHLVYQSAFAATDPVGYHHGATAGDIDHTGHIDIFVTGGFSGSSSYFLLNDGHGHFTVDTTRVPSTILRNFIYTCELIDVDYDGNLDLVVGGHEYNGMPTEIFWGNGTGFYSDTNKTVLPADAQFGIVLDIDSEDINHDGLRDLVITRTAQVPFYTGFYFQVVMQTSRHVFADQSLPRLIHDRSTWIGNTGRWVDWIHLVDITGDSARDIVVDDASRHLGWTNDGNGYFTFTGGW